MKRRDTPLPTPEGGRYWSFDHDGGAKTWFRFPGFDRAAAIRPLLEEYREAIRPLIDAGQAAADKRNAEVLAAWEAATSGPQVEGVELPPRPEPIAGGLDLFAAAQECVPSFGAMLGFAWHDRMYALEAKQPEPVKGKLSPDAIRDYGAAVFDELQDHYAILTLQHMGTAAMGEYARRYNIVGEAAKSAAFFGPKPG